MKQRTKTYVTLAQLRDVILGLTHAMPIGIVTTTDPKMLKTNNPFYGRVVKLNEANVFVGSNYEAAVNRQREREGKEADFQAGQRGFAAVPVIVDGKRTPLLSYTRKDGVRCEYLEVHFRGHLKTVSKFILDGTREIARSVIAEFLPAPRPSNTQQLETEITVRTFAIENIVELRANGVDYVVIRR